MAPSKCCEVSEPSEISETETFYERQNSDWERRSTQELPNTNISEAENTSIMPEMTGCGMAVELDSRTSEGPRISVWSPDHVSPSHQKTWSYPPFGNEPKSLTSPPRPEPILTRINTSAVYDPLARSCQSEHTSPWSDTPLSATIISPLSATDGMNPGMQEVSPTESEASGKSFFTDSGYTSATSNSLWNGSSSSIDQSADPNETRHNQLNQSLKAISEERCREEILSRPSNLPTISIVASCQESTPLDARTATHSANRCPVPIKIRTLSPHWSDASSLVESFAEVMDEHMHHSKEILKQLQSTPTIRELLSMPSTTMLSIGLETLAGILGGRNPTGIMHVFAFTHIAYAFAIAIDHDETKVHTPEWFQDSLSWASDLAPERHQEMYMQIAHSIWQPFHSLGMERQSKLEITKSLVNNDNSLLRACKHFLDSKFASIIIFRHRLTNISVLESFGNCESQSSSSNSRFNFMHTAFANKVRPQIVEKLIMKTSIEAFIEDVTDVERRLENGLITNIRELELELICAGKVSVYEN
jgi:hypothetical protein